MKRHSTLCVVEDLMGLVRSHEIAIFEYTFPVNGFSSKFICLYFEI